MFTRRPTVLSAPLAALILGLLAGGCQSSVQSPRQTPRAIVEKQPVAFADRTFDPANPPPDMPPLAPGEEAECESNFLSDVNIGGRTLKTDATHALVTVTHIKMTLQLKVTIWTPADATPHVIEHEQGHRQIAEYYYQTAGELAQRIAEPYMAETVEVTGTDLNAESTKRFQQVASQIADEYSKELNPDPAQLLYDGITDHGRNDVVVKDAVASSIKNVAADSPQPAPAASLRN